MFGMSATRTNKILIEHNIIYRRGGYHHPKQKYTEKEWFTYKTHRIKPKVTKTHLYLTQRGRYELYKLMVQWGYKAIMA